MSIKKLGTDLWQIRLTYKDQYGVKRDLRRRFSGSYGGAKAVEAELTAIRARGELSHWIDEAQRAVDQEASSLLTVREFSKTWLRDYAKHEMKPSSYRTAEIDLRVHALPAIGGRHLVEVRPKMISDLMRNISTERSARTANRVRTTLRSMFKWAVRWEYIERNPIDSDRVPKLRERRTGRFENFLTPEEATSFLKAIAWHATHSRRFPILLFLLETGVRFGEMAALTLDALDLAERRAVIYRSVNQGEVTSTKGEDERVCPLSPTLVAALATHLQSVVAEEHGNPMQLVFPNDVGGFLTPESMRWAMKAGRKGAGVDRNVTLHGLRHSFCTALALDGRSALEIAQRAGHASASTSQRYIHLAEALKAESPEILARLGVEAGAVFEKSAARRR